MAQQAVRGWGQPDLINPCLAKQLIMLDGIEEVLIEGFDIDSLAGMTLMAVSDPVMHCWQELRCLLLSVNVCMAGLLHVIGWNQCHSQGVLELITVDVFATSQNQFVGVASDVFGPVSGCCAHSVRVVF